MSFRRLLRVAVSLALFSAGAAHAFEQQEYRAADGTAYQVIRIVPPLGGAADLERITTVAGAVGGVGSCNLTTTDASAVAGALQPSQSVHPFGSIRRTAILTPNDISTLSFDPNGSGTVTLGSGGGALKICRNSGNCSGVALTGLGAASGGVPAACIASGVAAGCEGNQRQTLGFGLSATGNPPVCLSSPTVNTTVCAAEPGDGIAMNPGQALVLIYSGSVGGFGIGAGGFGIDSNESGSCPEGGVVSAMAGTQSVPGPFRPTGSADAPAASLLGLAALAGLLAVSGVRRLRAAR
ncbi:MAG: hypothetical protein SF182_24645 [Deltaproteobacteria bacterium]|nr:hypothetical protein [Deltaproteobacteria bacterium]